MTAQQNVDVHLVRSAIKKLAEHKLHARLKRIDGSEASRMLPEIWPVIQELCTIADAAEAKMVFVKAPKPRPARTKTPQLVFTSVRGKNKNLSEEQIRSVFKAMDHPDASTRKLVESRRMHG